MSDVTVMFSDDVASPENLSGAEKVWTLLVIDDDQDVHNVTEFVMHGVTILGRRLKFLHAYSAAEGQAILEQKQDIAVILLDVVMESETAGLALVRTIRDELGYKATRIILHTGQPGYAPEYEAIRDYDINDYRNKSELNYSRLLTSLTAAIRSYIQIMTVAEQNGGLQFIINSAPRLIAQTSTESFPMELVREVRGLLGPGFESLLLGVSRGNGPESILCTIQGTGHLDVAAGMGSDQLGGMIKAPVTELDRLAAAYQSGYGDTWACLYISGLADQDQDQDLVLYLETGDELNDSQRQILAVFGVMVSVGYQNILLVKRLRNLAFEDSTTGLLNRNGFIVATDNARGTRLSDQMVALIDIEGFSEINEVLGHDYGDALLRAVAQRLVEHFPAPIVCARVSADGFALLGQTELLGRHLIDRAFSQPLPIQQQSMYLRFVCGMVNFDEVAGDGADLVKDAFIAVKIAKLQQKSRFYQYKAKFEEEARQKLELLDELQRSLVKGALEVHYQPQVEIGSAELTGLEALIRWRRDDGSYVPPTTFIPLAEQSGLIVSWTRPASTWSNGSHSRSSRCGWRSIYQSGNSTILVF